MTPTRRLGQRVLMNAERLRDWTEAQHLTLTLAWLTVMNFVGWTVTVIVCR